MSMAPSGRAQGRHSRLQAMLQRLEQLVDVEQARDRGRLAAWDHQGGDLGEISGGANRLGADSEARQHLEMQIAGPLQGQDPHRGE